MAVTFQEKKDFRDSFVEPVKSWFDPDQEKNSDKDRKANVTDNRNYVVHDKNPSCLRAFLTHRQNY